MDIHQTYVYVLIEIAMLKAQTINTTFIVEHYLGSNITEYLLGIRILWEKISTPI